MTAGIQIEFDEVEANFTIVPNQIIYNRDLTSDARFLWLYLRSHRVGYAIGYRQMELDLGWSEVTVRKHLKALEAAGYVAVTQTRIGSRNGKLSIHLLLGSQPIKSEVSKSEVSEIMGLNKTKENNKTKEPTKNPHPEAEEAFRRFWSFYPRKVEKIDAERAFLKALSSVDAETIIAGAQRLADDPNLPPKQFIPYPARWLNAGGWESEPYPERELTPEEKQAIAKAKADADRAAALAENQRLRAESEQAKARAVPAPRCPHGKSIVSCIPCLKNVSRNQ